MSRVGKIERGGGVEVVVRQEPLERTPYLPHPAEKAVCKQTVIPLRTSRAMWVVGWLVRRSNGNRRGSTNT